MFNYSHGRFTSPDYFANDTHTSDPQSWNLYVYVRNNPLRFVDPLGEKAKITTQYDEKTKTMRINIKASFAVYGAEGQNISQEELEKQKAALLQGLQTEYGKSFEVDGITYEMSADIDVQIAGSEADAISKGVDNIVEVGNQALESQNEDGNWEGAGGVSFRVKGENFDRMVVNAAFKDPNGQSANMPGVYAHEFTHLLGFGTHAGRNLYQGSDYRSTRQLRMTKDDFTNYLFPKTGGWSGGSGSSAGFVNSGPYNTGSPVRRNTNPTLELRRAASVKESTSNYRWQKRQ